MVKVPRKTLEQLLCLLAHVLVEHPAPRHAVVMEACFEDVKDLLHAQGRKWSTVMRETYNEGLGEINLADTFKTLTTCLLGVESSGGGSVIDTVMDILTTPYSRNVLTGENLRRLKDAILLPSDLSNVAEALRRELACVACGKPLVHGEGVTAVDGSQGKVFYCWRCHFPDYAPCTVGGCHDVVLPDRETFLRPITTAKCSKHSGKAEKPALVTERDIQVQEDNRRQRAERAAPNPFRNIGIGRRGPDMPAPPRFEDENDNPFAPDGDAPAQPVDPLFPNAVRGGGQ